MMMYPQIVAIFFLLLRDSTGQSGEAVQCLDGFSVEYSVNSTAITLTVESLNSTGNFTVNVSNGMIITIPASNDANLSIVIFNLCPQTEYNVTISGPPVCMHTWQKTFTTQSATSSLDITSTVENFTVQFMVNSSEDVQSPKRLSITFSWDQPVIVNCEIISYTLQWNNTIIDSTTNISYVWLNASAYLSPLMPYSFTITPITMIGKGDNLTVTNITIADVPYSAPQNLTVKVLSSSQIQVWWSPPVQPNGIISNYMVCYNKECINETLLSTTINGLSPLQHTVVTVSAVNSQGKGPENSTNVTTFHLPGVVSNLTHFPLGFSSLAVTWEEPTVPNGIIDGYGIKLWQNDELIQNVSVSTPLIYRFDNLMAFVKYKLEVLAQHSTSNVGNITTIENVFIQQKVPPQPMITIVVRSQSVISVSWSLPSFETGNLVSFEVWYAPTSSVLPGRYQNTSVVVPMDQYSTTINGTNPTLAYTIQVRARSGAGFGLFSPVYIARVINDFQTLSSNGTNVFQVRLFGNVLCNSTNDTQLGEIEQELTATLADYCDCAGLVTESNDTRLLCNSDPNWFVFRAVLEEKVVVLYGKFLQNWMQSQSPHIILNNQVLLVDSTCPSFTNSANSNSCMSSSSQLAGVVAGTFFGALILGFLLTVAVLAIVVIMLWIFRKDKIFASSSSKGSTPSLEEEESEQEEYEIVDISSSDEIEQSEHHYEYPQVLMKREVSLKNKKAKMEKDSGYENPLENVRLSSQNRARKKNQNRKKQKEPQVATFDDSIAQVTVFKEELHSSTQPLPTNVVHKQDLSITNEYTTEKERSLMEVKAAKKEVSGCNSPQRNPYEPLTLAVSESVPLSQQHSHKTKQLKKKPKAKLQSQQQWQDTTVQSVLAASQPSVAASLSSTAVQQPLANTLQPAAEVKKERKETVNVDLPTLSQPSETNQFAMLKAKLRKTSPAPSPSQKPMHPSKPYENQDFTIDQTKTKEQMKSGVTSMSDQAQVHAHTVQGTKDKQASISSLKQPAASQIRTNHNIPEKSNKDKEKKSQSTQPVVPKVKSSTKPSPYLEPIASASLAPDLQQKLAPAESTSSTAKNFWLEKSKETVAQNQAEGQKVLDVSSGKKTITGKPKPTTQPKPKGKSTATSDAKQNAAFLTSKEMFTSSEQSPAMEKSFNQPTTKYANFGLRKQKK